MSPFLKTEYYYLENLNRRDHFKDLGIDARIILTWLKETGCGLDSSGSR
jgi:hypothetical protein